METDDPVEWARRREAQFAADALNEAALRELVLKELIGGLWHTTHPDRFQSILRDGAILPNPSLPDSERWGANVDENHYPYVRTLGGISLFDFGGFDPDAYSRKYQSSSWPYFVPYHSGWGRAIWIELDRERLTLPQFLTGRDVFAKWQADNAHGHNFMPEIEAAHLGNLPTTAFKRAFAVSKETHLMKPLALVLP